jgi:hypothetical protein
MKMVWHPLLSQVSNRRKRPSSKDSSRASSRANSRDNNKVNNKANNQSDPASPCLVVADAEEVELMCLLANVQPVDLKRVDMVMLAVEDEEAVVVDAVV